MIVLQGAAGQLTGRESKSFYLGIPRGTETTVTEELQMAFLLLP